MAIDFSRNKTAPYADIYDYMGSANSPWNAGEVRSNQQAGGGGEGGGFGGDAPMGGGEGGGNTGANRAIQYELGYNASSPEQQALLKKYGQIARISSDPSMYGPQVGFDASKLPNQGNIKWNGGMGMHPGTYGLSSFKPVNEKTIGSLANPNAVIWDDNYGYLTPTENTKLTATDKFAEALPKVAVSALTMGAGSLGFPALALAGVNAAKAKGDGANWQQTLMGLAPSLIGGAMGGQFGNLGGMFGQGGFQLPAGLADLYKYGKMGYGAFNMFNQAKNFKNNPYSMMNPGALYNIYRGIGGG